MKKLLFGGVTIVLAIIFALYIIVQVNGCDWMKLDKSGPILRIFQFDNRLCSCEGYKRYTQDGQTYYLSHTYYGNSCSGPGTPLS